MLKMYQMPNGHIYQYEEGEQPEGAVVFEPKKKMVESSDKAVTPKNKARKAATKK